jgi:Mor family transcriptional regulator
MFKRFSGRLISLHGGDCDFIKVLGDLAGEDIAEKFYQEVKGHQIYIGNIKHFQIADRNKNIRDEFARNVSVEVLSEKYELSFQTIYNIIRNKGKQ